MFGAKALQGHSIPKVYGAIEPTAVFVPLKSILGSEDGFKTATTEVFGPLQVDLPALLVGTYTQHLLSDSVTSGACTLGALLCSRPSCMHLTGSQPARRGSMS